MIRGVVVSMAMAAALVLTGCSSSAPPAASKDSGASAEEQALYKSAQTEGQLTFYCAEILAACDAMSQAFTAKYPGVTARVIRIVSAEMSTRFEAEKTANAETADILLSSDFPFLVSAQDRGLTMPWTKAKIPGYPGDYPADWISKDTSAPFEVAVWAIAWNTDEITSANAPKAFADLTKAKYKGQMNGPDPSVSSAVAAIFGTIQDITGNKNYLKEMAAQNVKWFPGGIGAASQSMAAGESPVQAFANLGALVDLKKKGAPIDWVIPKVSTGAPFGWALNAKPKHPDAARLFAKWVTTKQASEVLFAANPGAASAYSAPEGVKVETPNFSYFDPEKSKQLLKDVGRPAR